MLLFYNGDMFGRGNFVGVFTVLEINVMLFIKYRKTTYSNDLLNINLWLLSILSKYGSTLIENMFYIFFPEENIGDGKCSMIACVCVTSSLSIFPQFSLNCTELYIYILNGTRYSCHLSTGGNLHTHSVLIHDQIRINNPKHIYIYLKHILFCGHKKDLFCII